MFSKKTLFALVAIVMVLTIALSGCARGEALAKEINLNLGTEPPTLDPDLAQDTTSIDVIQLTFLGLTDFDDETMETVPELATEWSVSSDGLVWTFKMRDDVEWVNYDPATQKFEKMGPVTANDIVYGVKRTLDPATGSPYAYVDYIIKGGEDVNTGVSTDMDSIGVRAVDDYTVEFTLTQPAGYFPGIAGMWPNRPVPQQAVEEFGDKWTEPGNIWTNGPYALDTWEHEASMVLVKNPNYYDAKTVSIERINYVMVVEDSTAFAMYENGELDVANAPLDDMDRIKADPVLSKELYIAPYLCTGYYGFNVTKPPFDNVLVRQAFSYATDRQKLIDTVLKGEQKPATTFAPPGIFGTPAEDETFGGITFDPEKARALLAEAGYPNGEGLPEITLMFNTNEGHQKIAEFMQATWKEVLNVEVKLANQEWAVYLETTAEDAPQIWRMAWCADYPDENNWVLEVFHPTKSENRPKWNPEDAAAQEFMQAVEDAAAASDPEERATLYSKAEKILCTDQAIIIPQYYYSRVVVNKPYVQRTYAALGGEHVDKWKVLAH
ncbi:MAG: peptide ABC transporter substrate-binding protein [Anaerolineae bacterium]